MIFAAAILTGAAVASIMEPAAAAQSKTVWDGIYTQEQAARGAVSFSGNCSRCHAADPNAGEEGKNLAGKGFWNSFRESTVDHLLDFVSKNMPNGAGAGSLSANTYADLVAYILSKNDLPSGSTELTKDSAAGVKIIAKGGPGELPNGTLVRIVGCLAGKEGSNWILNNGTAPERPDPAADPNDSTRPLGTRSYQLKFVLTSLQSSVGHRVRVRGLLIGEGGHDGINVTLTESVAESCN
jgi:S-disulfanyl-L-cysteine oxidoreductase SoxD